VIGLVALALAADAFACTCLPPDLERDLPLADGAVVGSVLERRQGGAEVTYVLRVEQAYKGDLDGRVEVVTAADGVSCGLDLAPGQRVGLLLERDGDTWRSGLCQQVDPAAFLEPVDVDDNALPPLNWGGYVLGMLVLGLLAFLVGRRYRSVRASRQEGGRRLR
jgi:hypothetical protein